MKVRFDANVLNDGLLAHLLLPAPNTLEILRTAWHCSQENAGEITTLKQTSKRGLPLGWPGERTTTFPTAGLAQLDGGVG